MEIATLECPRCHTEMFDGAHFCVRCGCRLDEVKQAAPKLLASRPPAPYSELLSQDHVEPTKPAESVHEALSRAVAAADAPEVAPIAPAPTPSLPGGIEASLREIDADFGAFAPPQPTTLAAVSPEAMNADSEDPRPPRRQPTMAEYSRDEVLRRARLKQSLKRVGLAGIDLSAANLEGVDFARADLEGANLENAKLRGANFKSANLRGAKLSGADLAQADLDKADLEDAALDRANLEGAKLKHACLEGASLEGANLSQAMLCGAELTAASLGGAVLRGADLTAAELDEAELGMADLSGANLLNASLQGATLDGALLHGARVGGTSFTNARSVGTAVDWLDASPLGDGSLRLDGARALSFLRGEGPGPDLNTTRYFGKGDVLRDATLEFGENSRIHIDSRFESCAITLGEGAELTIGEAGVLKNCAIVGKGKVVVHGRFFERQSPGIVGVKSLFVSARGGIVGGVEQYAEGTHFGFEPGCRLRMKILRPRVAAAAE